MFVSIILVVAALVVCKLMASVVRQVQQCIDQDDVIELMSSIGHACPALIFFAGVVMLVMAGYMGSFVLIMATTLMGTACVGTCCALYFSYIAQFMKFTVVGE